LTTKLIKKRVKVLILHHDYHILNFYIVSKYNCQKILQDKINFDSEKIMESAEFRIDGYIEGIMAPDGEEQDAYILGVNQPVE